MIVTFVISQIYSHGYVYNSTVGYVVPFNYRSCYYDCADLINSVYYKEYLQSDRDSTSALQKVNKIVSSSTDFQQLAGCVSAQFSAKWAFEVTWIEAGDRYASRSGSGSGDTGVSTVRTVFRGCRRQPLYCFHFALVVWLHVTEIYIYIYIYNVDAVLV